MYGESSKSYARESQHRHYLLGNERVKEAGEYDHVGLKTCTGGDNSNRTIEKIKKGRTTLNAASGIGLKRGGLTMRVCSFLFWSLIVPIVTYASELWVLKDEDVRLLDEFQRYAGRRVQRFPYHTPNETAFSALGWMRIENFIAAKKLIFMRTIAVMNEQSPVKNVVVMRCDAFMRNIEAGLENKFDSPVFSILKMAICFGILDKVINGTVFYNKRQWRDIIWQKAWSLEDEDWEYRLNFKKFTARVDNTMGGVNYLVWVANFR